MDYSKQKILTDVDGVLLDWTSSFEAWLKETQNIHVEYSTDNVMALVKIKLLDSLSVLTLVLG